MKRIKAFTMKMKWVLFGGKPYRKAVEEINEKVYGIAYEKPKNRFRPSNGNYASTKRCSHKKKRVTKINI